MIVDDLGSPDSPRRRVLVVGATGTMGSQVLRQVLAQRAVGASVRVLVRRVRPDLPRDVEQIVGDLDDAETVRRALTDMTSAFYVSPHDPREIEFASSFVSIAQELGVRIVFAGVHISSRTLRGRLQLRLVSRFLPHYRGKLEVGRLIERCSPDAVILAPACFFENDDLFLDEIVEGRYPAPIKRMPRIGASDIGAIVTTALLQPGFASGTHVLHGTPSLTGEDCARIWSAALGRPVVYTGDDAQEWKRVSAHRLPPGHKGVDFRATYLALGRVPVRTDRRAMAATTALLGRDPQTYEDWVAERARSMRSLATEL